MDTWDALVIAGGALLFVTLGIAWLKNRPAILKKYEEIPDNVKKLIIATVPVVFSEDDLKNRYRFNWKKLIIVDGLVCLGVCISEFKLRQRGAPSTWEEFFGLMVSLVILCSVVAIAIDSYKFIKMWIMKDRLYCQLGYIHSEINGHAVLSYYDFNREEFVTKQVYLSEDEIKNSKIYTNKSNLVNVILYVKGDKIKYMALDW